MFNKKQRESVAGSGQAAADSKREAIWIERDLLGPLAGTGTAFLHQVSATTVLQSLSTALFRNVRPPTGGARSRPPAAPSTPTGTHWRSSTRVTRNVSRGRKRFELCKVQMFASKC